jgi:hypothetical protein
MTNIITENLTEPSRENPIQGDKIKFTNTETGSIIIKHYNEPYVETQEDIDYLARSWRDTELISTDHIVPLVDHPDHAATLAYRVALRDWPSTSDFPDTKPTL